jgi:hypothetical protein
MQPPSSPPSSYTRLMSPKDYASSSLGAFLTTHRAYSGHGNLGISIPHNIMSEALSYITLIYYVLLTSCFCYLYCL